MGCNYTYPAAFQVERVFWSRLLAIEKEPPELSLDPKYRGRVQYLGDTQGVCGLRLSGVTEQDQGKYYFRFITTPAEKYQGKDGVYLSVTELQVVIPDTVVEGKAVTLTCKTGNGISSNSTFIWNKHGSRLPSSTNLLHLPSVSRRDVGRYSCAVKKLQSCEVTLQLQLHISRVNLRSTESCSPPNTNSSVPSFSTVPVLNAPKNVSVSISPSGEIVEGSLVTLICSSDANPPVQTYTWYKGKSSIGTGKTYTISTVSPADSGNYTCKAENKHGHQSSTAVSLNVLYPPKRVSVSISPSGEIVEGKTVTLTCSSNANPPSEYTWLKGIVQKSKEKIYIIKKIRSEDSGEYKCKSSNRYGEKHSDGATLNVLYPPKSSSVSISRSGEIVEGGTVTLTCSSDAKPPAEYNWYKGTLFISKGKTYTIKNISSEDTGDYKCKSSNRYGRKYSHNTTVNVLYPPKNVSVSINRSGEIVENSSVTLTCSSDANPPVQNYTWYKVNESSPLGSGQSYSFTLSSNSSGWFYCAAQNKYGTQRAAAVPLTLNGDQSVVLYIAVGIAAGCGCLFLIIGVLCIRKKRTGGSDDAAKSLQVRELELVHNGYEETPVSSHSTSLNIALVNVDSSPPDDTYTSLDLPTRSSNDSYHTHADLHSSSIDDTYTALDLETMSSNDVYHTLGSVHPNPPDDVDTSLDSQSISSDYYNIPIRRNEHH